MSSDQIYPHVPIHGSSAARSQHVEVPIPPYPSNILRKIRRIRAEKIHIKKQSQAERIDKETSAGDTSGSTREK
ncbi:MAG: hypothetical protein QW240_05160 [Candidatus Caldarchaeum sp.]